MTLRSSNLALQLIWIALSYTEPLNCDCMQVTPIKCISGCKYSHKTMEMGHVKGETGLTGAGILSYQEVCHECDFRNFYSVSC